MQVSSAESVELLNLQVGGDSFAINIIDVQEIRVLEGLRKMPDTPEEWLGVIDFRNIIVPIVDLRMVFGTEQKTFHGKTVVVIVQFIVDGAPRLIGVVVDAVSEVMTIPLEDIRKPPDLNESKNNLVSGIFKHEGRIIIKLDVEELVLTKNFEQLQSQVLDVGNVD